MFPLRTESALTRIERPLKKRPMPTPWDGPYSKRCPENGRAPSGGKLSYGFGCRFRWAGATNGRLPHIAISGRPENGQMAVTEGDCKLWNRIVNVILGVVVTSLLLMLGIVFQPALGAEPILLNLVLCPRNLVTITRHSVLKSGRTDASLSSGRTQLGQRKILWSEVAKIDPSSRVYVAGSERSAVESSKGILVGNSSENDYGKYSVPVDLVLWREIDVLSLIGILARDHTGSGRSLSLQSQVGFLQVRWFDLNSFRVIFPRNDVSVDIQMQGSRLSKVLEDNTDAERMADYRRANSIIAGIKTRVFHGGYSWPLVHPELILSFFHRFLGNSKLAKIDYAGKNPSSGYNRSQDDSYTVGERNVRPSLFLWGRVCMYVVLYCYLIMRGFLVLLLRSETRSILTGIALLLAAIFVFAHASMLAVQESLR